VARNGTNAVEIAIAVRDSNRLRKMADRARVPETRMLQMLVADMIDRQVAGQRKNKPVQTRDCAG
jgi:hypothetical protein